MRIAPLLYTGGGAISYRYIAFALFMCMSCKVFRLYRHDARYIGTPAI